MQVGNMRRANRRLQLTAFGARDRAFFEAVSWSAPRRQLKRNTLDGSYAVPLLYLLKSFTLIPELFY
jgi:hypothetical protein